MDEAGDWKLPWEGGCRCGQVRIRITAPPMLTSACHCRGCQRMTGSAYALTLTIPSGGLEVTAGEPVIGGLHGGTRHFHCPRCMSWVFTRPEGMDHFVNVRATMLDDPSWFEPFAEFSTADNLPWAATGAKHSFVRQPKPEAFPPILAAFVREGARPR